MAARILVDARLSLPEICSRRPLITWGKECAFQHGDVHCFMWTLNLFFFCTSCFEPLSKGGIGLC